MPDILDSLSPEDLPAAGPDPQVGLADIKAADPGFDAGVFSDHARATFFAV